MNDSPTLVSDVMSTPLETIRPDATVRAAATRMREKDVSALIVTTSDPGIVTSTDILDAIAAGEDPDQLPVRAVMTENVERVSPDLRMTEVAAMMTNYGIKHLPVVDDDYVGMVSSTDVTAHLGAD